MDDPPRPAGAPEPLWLPIPRLLHSLYEEGPFRACSVCRQPLDDGRFYQVARKFAGAEPILEMAICMTCASSTSRDFSEHSMKRMQRFVTEEVRLTPTHEACHACGARRDGARQYEVAGLCTRGHLIAPVLVVCGTCSDRVVSELSKSTRERYGEFFRDVLPGVPEGVDILPHLVM